MVRCENGHEYHVCECGFGVLCGSSYAEHKMGCKAVPLWIDSAGVPHYLGEIIGPMFTTSGTHYCLGRHQMGTAQFAGTRAIRQLNLFDRSLCRYSENREDGIEWPS